TSRSVPASAAAPPKPRSRGSSPRATSPTSTTGRRSRPPASAAWRRWMRSGSWTRANSSERSRLPRERLQPRVPCHDGPDGLETRGWRRSTRFRDFGIGGTSFLADIRILERLADVPAAAWDALHDSRNPFVAHAFLEGLERHHCIRGGWGWTPRHLTLWEGDDLVAAAPGYLK